MAKLTLTRDDGTQTVFEGLVISYAVRTNYTGERRYPDGPPEPVSDGTGSLDIEMRYVRKDP